MTDLTPPPAGSGAASNPAASGYAPAAPAASGFSGPTADAGSTDNARLASRAVAITVTVLGAAALVVSGTGTAFAALYESRAGLGDTGSVAVSTAGVSTLDIDVSRGDVSILFADVAEAELAYTGELNSWELEREGSTLSLSSPESRFGWSDWGWFRGLGDDEHATLTLPRSLEGADLDVDLAAGRLLVDGEFGEVTVGMGAGLLEIEGSATAVDARIGAGRVILELADVQMAEIDLSAGYLYGDFTGEAPDHVDLDVSAGALELRLPDLPYALSVDRSAGTVETNNLHTSSTAPRTIDVTVAAGRIDLRAN